MHEIVTLGKTRVNTKVVPAHNTLSYNVVDILCLSVLFLNFFLTGSLYRMGEKAEGRTVI